MSVKNAWATDSAEYGCAKGMKWQYLLKQSTTVRMMDLPRTRGRASTKSSDVGPDPLRNWKRKQQPSLSQVFGFIPLADHAHPNELLHQSFHVKKVEVAAQPMQRALNAFVPLLVDGLCDFLEGRRRRDVEPPVELDHAIDQGPWRVVGPCSDLIAERHEARVRGLCVSEASDEVEPRGRQGEDSTCVLRVAAG